MCHQQFTALSKSKAGCKCPKMSESRLLGILPLHLSLMADALIPNTGVPIVLKLALALHGGDHSGQYGAKELHKHREMLLLAAGVG